MEDEEEPSTPQDSPPATNENSRAGLGFEAQKNYLLNLIASLENYRRQRMTLEKNKFGLLDEHEDDDFAMSTHYSVD